MNLLNRDNIKLEEISDYHIYPIADNDTPKLSADRLEYTLSDGLVTQNAFDLESIEQIYNDISILKNEEKEYEIGFNTKKIAEEYIDRASIMWHLFSGNCENNMIMQFWTDILRKMAKEKYITEDDLYKYSEKEIVDKIKNCPNSEINDAFNIFSNTKKIGRSNEYIEDKYCISIKVKKRYTNPLVKCENGKNERISTVSDMANKKIQEIKNYEDSKYAYIDIDSNIMKI